jgi:hypothetical protein
VKVISSMHGRVMQIYVADEVRGPQDFYWPQVVQLINERYGFLKHSDLATAAASGIKFEAGRFLTAQGAQISIQNLDIYNDGIVVICRDTSDAELVLEDATAWGFETFKLRHPKTVLPRTYTSWLVVDLDKPIANMLAKFSEVRRLIATSYEAAYGTALDFQMQRVAFNVDPKTVPQFTQTDFAIDRRGNTAYSLNRFFCTAPLKTEGHIALLQQIERTLK